VSITYQPVLGWWCCKSGCAEPNQMSLWNPKWSKKTCSAAKIVHLVDSIPHFTMLFGVNFRESLRVWPLLRGQNLKCTSTSWINHTNLTCSKATRISVIWLYMYIEYTHPANMYVCVCVVDIHVVHCFYEVRKYKYHSGRVICPNFLSRGMNLEKEKNLWSISLSMTHGPTYPYRKKTEKKKQLHKSQLYNLTVQKAQQVY